MRSRNSHASTTSANRDGLTAIGLPPPVPPLDHCPVPIELDQPIPIHQPQEPGAIDPGKGPFAVGAKQIERSPAERRRLLEKSAASVDERLQAPQRHIGGRRSRSSRVKPSAQARGMPPSCSTIAARSSLASPHVSRALPALLALSALTTSPGHGTGWRFSALTALSELMASESRTTSGDNL